MPFIESIKFVKSQVSIALSDGRDIMLLSDIYYSSGLKEGIDYDNEHIKKIIEENSELHCKNALLKIVSRRIHSTGEIRKKLSIAGFSSLQISKVLSRALDSGIVNDETAADCFLNELICKGYGLQRIKEAFRKKGFPGDIIETKLADSSFDRERELQNGRAVFQKKLTSLTKLKVTDKNKLRERLYRHMLSKGYSSELIFSLMNEIYD